MVTDPKSYDLSELSAAAGVTPRTVRYYVQQGLLPAPGTRGPGTRYDRAYLERLQLIRRLQRQHLPLAEIRKQLESLDDSSVRDALANAAEPSESSALEYVHELLGRQSERQREPEAQAPSRSMFGAAFRRVVGEPSALHQAVSPPTIQQSRSTRSTWERISLAPDVELHVRRPLSREQNRQVERLLEAARDLFAEEP